MRWIHPSEVRGSLRVPSSKSVVQRLLTIGLLTRGTTEVEGVTFCEDVQATLGAVQSLGAEISREGDRLRVVGTGLPSPAEVHCGESALCLRMMSAVAALGRGTTVLRAEGTLRSRPLPAMGEAFRDLGARWRDQDGFPPVEVTGPLQGGETEVPALLTSQVVTGLLIALPRAPSDSLLRVRSLQSAPYVEMTLDLLEQAGVRVLRRDLEEFRIPGNQRYLPRRWWAEGDWSAAAFLLVAGAIAGAVHLRGLSASSRQGDRRVLEALAEAGAQVVRDQDEIRCIRRNLQPFSFDATPCPDLIPPLVALAACIPGESRIHGVHRLRFKESDRAESLGEVLEALGVSVAREKDAFRITGGRPVGGRVHARGDHRVAMAAAVMALMASGPVLLEDPDCVAKSYPTFFQDLASLGVRTEEVP